MTIYEQIYNQVQAKKPHAVSFNELPKEVQDRLTWRYVTHDLHDTFKNFKYTIEGKRIC